MQANDLAGRVRALQARGGLTLPPPGGGKTAERHRALLEFGRVDLSVARIAEAHTDAIAILVDGGHKPARETLYGVWASDGARSKLTATVTADGRWRLEGVKQYCSGASIVDFALVTARLDDNVLLFNVPLNTPGITVLPSTWLSPAFADTMTGPVSFSEVELPADALIGDPNWYLNRPGFWHGAIGPAACWAGGAISLVDAAVTLNRNDAHSRANLGALQAIGWGLVALLNQSGDEIDVDRADTRKDAQVRALKARHLIERWCVEVMDRFGRATGPQLLAYDERAISQYAALTVYIRQCHGERDLESITANS